MEHPDISLQQQDHHPQHTQAGRGRGRGRGQRQPARGHRRGTSQSASTDLRPQTQHQAASSGPQRPDAQQTAVSGRDDERQPNSRKHHGRPPQSGHPTDEPGPSTAIGTTSSTPSHPPRPSRPVSGRDDERQPNNRKHHGRPPPSGHPTDEPGPFTAIGTTSSTPSHPPRPSRRAKFKATLTEQVETQPSPSSAPQRDSATAETRNPKPRRARQPAGDDLTSTLTHALRTPPYPDCPICFNAIRPEQSTWSCSPPSSTEARTPGEGEDKDKDGEGTCCWSTFHLKCIRAWAEKSVKELQEAWRARGESRPGEWRCPGCRSTRQAVPQTYMCFCLRMRHPAPPRIATPHSCAQPCSRTRLGCRHACPLPCHPGPCPPCAVTIQVACFCGKERRSAKCHVGLTVLSCTQPCRKRLGCGNSEHLCAEPCHEGPCPPCLRREDIRCWCGQQTKSVACGEIKANDGTKCVLVKDDGSEQVWTGTYGCGHPCERPLACLHHRCSKICHPPSSTPPSCPFDPERVISCACGRCRVARSPDELAANGAPSSSALLPPRTSCTSPLPTCTSPCSKPLLCGHLCQATCHWDPCPPCTEQVERTCRCGTTKHKTPCSDAILALQPANDTVTPASETILCDKPCQALRSCGRHQCGRICCPLASLASFQRTVAKSGKRRDASHADLEAQLLLQLDPAIRAFHDCELPCGRVLSCGNHFCPRPDHKGPCDVCPRGVFEELVCVCGRTVLEPPIQCGTRLRCVYPCARPPPACGHPHVPHACHEEVVIAGADVADEGLGLVGEGDGRPCPPCPFLTEKLCACGKKQVGNVRCSQERVSCGSKCGKLLSCGFHHCERLCHADVCGTCTAVCGKPRRSCLPAQHPCTQTCHAPAACPETEPCHAPVVLTCPCGNLRSTIPCSGTKLVLACTGECEIRKRNARLAEALGISEDKRDSMGKVTWSTELADLARGLGPKFLSIAEKAFADFVASDRRTQVLPHMPPERRKFIHDLASVYRMDTIMVDQEPHRSVQLIRRIDTRVPTPLLSQFIASMVSGEEKGKLVDLKSLGKGGVGRGTSVWGSPSGNSGVGAGMAGGSRGVGASAGKWSTVAQTALGAARSESTTPARVPSPAAEVVISCEASPGPSRMPGVGRRTDVGAGAGGETKGVWMSRSVQSLRERARASTTASGDKVTDVGVAEETSVKDVPNDWEDDV